MTIVRIGSLGTLDTVLLEEAERISPLETGPARIDSEILDRTETEKWLETWRFRRAVVQSCDAVHPSTISQLISVRQI